jgi:hypothetical protein
MNAFRTSAVVCAISFASAAPVLEGCRTGSVCNPPGSTLGQIVKMDESKAYRSRADAQNGGDTPHLACRAEATIPTATLMANPTGSTGNGPGSAQGVDPRAPMGKGYFHMGGPGGTPPPQDVTLAEGEYRVLGVGRGVDREDCGQAALQACNEAIDAYCLRAQMVRPLGVVCQLAESQEYCAR